MQCPRCGVETEGVSPIWYYHRLPPPVKTRFQCPNGHRWAVYTLVIPGRPPMVKVFECVGFDKIACRMHWFNYWDAAVHHHCNVNKPRNFIPTQPGTPEPD